MTARATLIKLVHAGARKLFSDDDERRAWQRVRTCRSGCKAPCQNQAHCTGYASCSDMTDADMENLVAEWRRKKALDPPRAPRRAGRVPFNRSPYMSKIEALLADMGLSWQYAESIAYNVTGGKGKAPNSQPGLKRLEWVKRADHFRAIIAALHVEQEKRGYLARIDLSLEILGKGRDYIDNLVPEKQRGKWQRNRALLLRIIGQLDNELQGLD